MRQFLSGIRPLALILKLAIGVKVPHGRGKEADIFFTYSATIKDLWNFSNQLVIACSNEMNGLYRADKDLWSDFHSTYEAGSKGYQPKLVFTLAITTEKLLADSRLKESAYLVFRIRTVLDDMGNIVSARYGKSMARLNTGRVIQIPVARFASPTTSIPLPTTATWNLTPSEIYSPT